MFRPQITMTMTKQPSPRKNDTTTDSNEIDWDVVGQKAAIVQETAETVGKLVLKAYAAKRVLDTVCEIAVIVAKAKLK